jgi:hypothetical protein
MSEKREDKFVCEAIYSNFCHSINMILHQRFFEAAKLDLEATKVLTEKNLCQPAIYHLQQAFEKCKVIFHF